MRAAKLYLGTQKKWSLNFVSFCAFHFDKKQGANPHHLVDDENSMDTAGLKNEEDATFLTEKVFFI